MDRIQKMEAKADLLAQGTTRKKMNLLAAGLCLPFGLVLLGACGLISAEE